MRWLSFACSYGHLNGKTVGSCAAVHFSKHPFVVPDHYSRHQNWMVLVLPEQQFIKIIIPKLVMGFTKDFVNNWSAQCMEE